MEARDAVPRDEASRDGVVRGLRERLFAAAREVFAESGYAGATVEAIVHRAGCTKGAFYHYFSSKEELFLALLEERVEAMLRDFRRAWNRIEPLEVNARRAVERFVAGLDQDPVGRDLQIEFWAQAVHRPEVRVRLAATYARWREFLVDVAARELPPDLVPIAVPHLYFWATLLIALQDGLALHNRLDPERVDLRHWREHLASALLAVLDRGLPPRVDEALPGDGA